MARHDDDEDDDRPRRRRRRREDEEDADEPPRRRGPDDEDEDEPPRRRRPLDDDDDDYEDRPRRRRRRRVELGWLDQQFLHTNVVLLVLFSFCCSGIALVFGIVGLAAGRDPEAKKKALIVVIISAILTVIYPIVFIAVGAFAPKGGMR